MDSQSQFDLTTAIQTWTSQFEQSGSFTNDELQELTSHLLDSIDALQAKDLSQQEAFLIASQRLGSIDLLDQEFTKLSRPVPQQREPVLLLLGALCFIFSRNLSETITGYGAVWFASYFGDTRITLLLDVSVCLATLVGLQLGGMRLIRQNHRVGQWFFHQLKQRPIGLTVTLGSLVGLAALGAYFAEHRFADLVAISIQKQWINQQFNHIHHICWLGFYLTWLLMFLQVVLPYATNQRLLVWLEKAPVGWLVIAGLCVFTCCLGLSIMGMRIMAPEDGIARFYISAGVCCLLSSFALADSPRYNAIKRLLICMAPLFLWYVLAVGTAVVSEERPSYLLLDWFPIKFFVSAIVGALTGMWLGVLRNRSRAIV
ncbi:MULTISPECIES: permease prefix domain 1-containing protein [unclassified Spirosoma]|uniref:permease prefix domain 1-containing protein n=1 Tax=unclassified Spirosoma TaxID=2621999 RepID=UPI00095EFC6B|nr:MULTISPECIES: permease prefix domain 1-containing protein [unclassified Spirosoma]MBN8826582.1 hypothetical protein [Spirosoma sp.]OJW72845.1 MAG: hypothetical protein BGO59_08615 [Spirosoma sp. 48-14]